MGQRRAPAHLERHAVVREHLLCERRHGPRVAEDDGHLIRSRAGGQRVQHLGRHQLELGAGSTCLEDPHRVSDRQPRRAGLEQAALEMVQRRARARGVMLVAGGAHDLLVRDRGEARVRPRPAGEG